MKLKLKKEIDKNEKANDQKMYGDTDDDCGL